MKRLVILIMCILMIMQTIPVFAYDYPPGFWDINNKYVDALDRGNHKKIIEYGNQILDLMQGAPEGWEKRELLVMRYNQLGISYAAVGDYDNAAKISKTLYDYAGRFGDEYYDYRRAAKAKMLQYTSEIRMYTENGQSPYFGAVNEKRNGVLFGLCATGETRSKLDNESMVLTYQELGQTLLSYNVGVVRDAASKGLAVEFALNCPREGNDIRNIRRMDSYLKEISDLFKKYPDVPIYLRFAAEFDIWENPAEPDEFVTAFRHVSEYFQNRNDNVAIVWSPNHTSNWYVDIDEYYPGDEYVDWVGISLYAQMYFKGDPNQKEDDEIAFKTGINSNPVLAVKDIIEKYGDRKPIMLSESGCGHKLMKRGENITDFALQRLKEYYYYLPMVYPEIKLIAHFDWYVDADTEKYDYRLSSNSSLQNEYLKLVKGRRFIQDKYSNNTDFCYCPIYNGIKVQSIFELSCYAHLYDSTLERVVYFIDDEYVGESAEIPFTTMVDASDYAGKHRLKAIAVFDNGKKLETSSNIVINNVNVGVTVEIDDEEIYFDQDPVIYNNRTMVPMRKIFEELGANVSWNAETQTATGKKGDRSVKVTLGQDTMYINNKKVVLDTVPFALSGRTLVPVRAVAEGLGCEVDWDSKNKLVSITPKVFTWSDWEESLPNYVNSDLYYIEEQDEYRVRTREKDYFTLDYMTNRYNFVDSETSYGSWSDWSNDYISGSDTREVQTRTQSSPKKYYYAHYCTGNESDESIRYRTANYEFCDECSYHALGWYDSPLSKADDGVGYIKYKDDGKKYRCSNTCYRWYVFDTSGGDYTQYRSRHIYKEYTYWQWDYWSNWSSWREGDPYDYYDWHDDSVDIDERTVYRFKEKG